MEKQKVRRIVSGRIPQKAPRKGKELRVVPPAFQTLLENPKFHEIYFTPTKTFWGKWMDEIENRVKYLSQIK